MRRKSKDSDSMHMCRKLRWLFVLFLFVSDGVQSQTDTLNSPVFKGYFSSFLYDARETVLFPRNLLKKDVLFLAGSSVMVGAAFLADKPVETEFRKNNFRAKVNSEIIRYGVEPWGSGLYPSLFAAGCYSIGAIYGSRELKYSALVQMKTLGFAVIVTGGAKLLFQRHRPNEQYKPDPFQFEGPLNGLSGHYSFPSGHTFKAFAWASSTASSLEGHAALKVAVYTLAALTGASRIYEGQHWLSDVAAGAVLGYAFGRFSWRIQQFYHERTFIRRPKQSVQ